MADDLIATDASSQLALATTRFNNQLAVDSGPKRRTRFAPAVVAKKGKRWAPAGEKPYKPLPYLDLPIGLTEQEVDQFFREARLKDLTYKMHTQTLEDVDPDIRPPSPPPVYDSMGNRTNSRETRIQKEMTAEFNRLVRYMIKTLPGYAPPPNYKPTKLATKLIIPKDKYPDQPFMGVVIGARGVNHKRLQELTGCTIRVRGRDIDDKFQTEEECQMPQHIHIEADHEEQIEAAKKLIEPLLDPHSEEFIRARDAGMEQLATVTGFAIAKAEQRCSVCGALGHLGFECPENQMFNYQMANVVCGICGDKGHVATDCPVANAEWKAENRDWKKEAEAEMEANKALRQMMSEINGDEGGATEIIPENPKGKGKYGEPAWKKTRFDPLCPPVPASMMGPSDVPGALGALGPPLIVPDDQAGLFVGRGGSNVNPIKAESGCNITLQPMAQGGKVIVITGGSLEGSKIAYQRCSDWLRRQQGTLGGQLARVGGTGFRNMNRTRIDYENGWGGGGNMGGQQWPTQQANWSSHDDPFARNVNFQVEHTPAEYTMASTATFSKAVPPPPPG